MIWSVLLGIAVLAMALMVLPLWRRTEGDQPRSAFDAQVYRDQLSEVELDADRGRITPDQAASARTEIARRLLAATADDSATSGEAGRLTASGAAASTRAARRGISVFVALAVPIATFGVYLIIGSPHLPARPAAEVKAELGTPSNPAQADGTALITRLGERLKERPNDLRGWTLYAQSLAQTGRYDEAVAAYSRVTSLAPRDAELMSRMAETQILAAQGSVTPAARASLQATLALDPAEPRARYYLGLAESQAGKDAEALRIWIALEADSAPNAPWRAILAERIDKLAARGALSPDQLAARRKAAAAASEKTAASADRTAPQPRGPTAADVKAAQSMPEEDRMAMIRGMVEGLAERLKDNPDDIEGWQRLARSYNVLGEVEKAREAYGHLVKLQPENVDALAAYAGAIARALPKDAAIPPSILDLGDRILRLDPKHAGALWFTGMALAEGGNPDGARERWTRLLAELDPGSSQYSDVQKSIEALDRARQ